MLIKINQSIEQLIFDQIDNNYVTKTKIKQDNKKIIADKLY